MMVPTNWPDWTDANESENDGTEALWPFGSGGALRPDWNDGTFGVAPLFSFFAGQEAATGVAGNNVRASASTQVAATATLSSLSLPDENAGIRIVDVIPQSDSAEADQNSEPSIAVDPLNPSNIIVGAFGSTFYGNLTPFFISSDSGASWSDFGALNTVDKSLAWSTDGLTIFAATLTPRPNGHEIISLYSATTSSTNFGSSIFAYEGINNTQIVDQPSIVTDPSNPNDVYIAYNDLGASNGKTASVLVSTDGGSSFTPVTLDKVGAPAGQDAPSVRLAASDNGRVYAAFTRWNSGPTTDSAGNDFYGAQIVVVRSDSPGADSFDALGTGGNGVSVAPAPVTSVFSNQDNSTATLGQERTGGDLAIAVDPNDANHVVIAYQSSGGPNSGVLQLKVAESTDGGNTWTIRFITSLSVRTAEPALAILDNGTIGFLYDSYDPGTNELSQHFVTTTDDFATLANSTLAVESNATPASQFDPYLGDFFDLTAVGNTFDGVFCASNIDNGTNALFGNVTFQRDYTGTSGTASFHLVNSSGHAVAGSVDPFFFTYTLGVIVHSGSTYSVGSGQIDNNDVVESGGTMFVLSGGVANATEENSGGLLFVESGGLASGTVVSGNETVSAGGGDVGATINGGTQFVYGSASSATILAGSQVVEAGGTADATIVSGGTQLVSGYASGGSILVGAQVVEAGGTASAATVNGGTQLVSGYANGGSILAGAQVVEAGGTASAAAIKGGTQRVFGYASGASISTGVQVDGHGGTLVTQQSQTPHSPLLAHPHG